MAKTKSTKTKKPLGAVALKHKVVLEKMGEKVGKGEIPSISKAGPEAGYSPSYSRGGKMIKTQSFQHLMAERIKEKDIIDAEQKQMGAARLSFYYFPKNMSDDEIKEVIEAHSGCKFRKAVGLENTKRVYYHAPDNLAIGKSLDRIYKVNKHYTDAPTIINKFAGLSKEDLVEIILGGIGGQSSSGDGAREDRKQ